MKKLFDKNEVTFAIVMIVFYIMGNSVMGDVSEIAGIANLGEMLFNIAMSAALLLFIRKHDLSEHLGLCGAKASAAKMLFYIPLYLTAARGIFFGLGIDGTVLETVFRTVQMLFVGFLEEIIFRGFLYRGIEKQNEKRAIIISALTFGIGHIVNLFNGYDMLSAVVQIAFAVVVGFVLVYIFNRTGSLIHCIAFHSLNNMLAGFTTWKVITDLTGSETTMLLINCISGIVILGAYLLYILKCVPVRGEQN